MQLVENYTNCVYKTMHTINPTISKRQNKIIIGTILGGSSIVKPSKGRHCYLAMRSRNIKWIERKASELFSLSSDEPFTSSKHTNRWHSLCYPIFDEYRKMFYKDGVRHIKSTILDTMYDLSMAIWYMDSGLYHNKEIILNTHVWGEKGTNTIERFFRIGLNFSTRITTDRGRFRIMINPDSSQVFFKIISPYTHVKYE